MLLLILLATIAVSAVSLAGIIIFFKPLSPSPLLKNIISLAAGAMLAVSFLNLLPESLAASDHKPQTILGITLASMVAFFLFGRALHWHSCHGEKGHRHATKQHMIYSNLIGDALHNAIDGFLIAGAFMLNIHTGLIVTLSVMLHEIPQEISDFGILLYGGFSKAQAIIANICVALTAVTGALIFYYFGSAFTSLIPLVAAFAAGNFIYLAAADLIPELENENNPSYVIMNALWLVIGVVLIIGMTILLPEL